MATLRQLEYLVAIVDTGSFTRAAEQLHVTQPGLSHQVLALEREAGGALLERLPRGIRLTAAGRAMLPYARSALAEAERAGLAARRAAGIATGELQVATLYSISFGILPTAFGLWRPRHPGVRVRLFEYRRTDELSAAMIEGRADVAIGPLPPGFDGVARELGSEEFVVVTAVHDPAAAAGSVRLSELADREWVHFTPASGLADILDRVGAACGFQPRAAVRTEQASTAANYAAAGLGPTLVPANTVPPRFQGAVLQPEPPVRRALTAYTRTEPDPVTAAFIGVLADEVPLTPNHVRRRLRPASSDDSVIEL